MSSASQSTTGLSGRHACDECQRTFDTEQGLRTHLGMIHDESLLESRICPACKQDFEPERERQEYCTRSCVNDANRNRDVVVCIDCDEEFEVIASHTDRYSRCESCRNTTSQVELSCACCYVDFEVDPSVAYRRQHCSDWCKALSQRTHFGYGGKLRRYTRPSNFRELIRHAYFYEGHSFEATCRIVNTELDGEFTEAKIKGVVEDLKTHERNVRNRVWALRPEDLGLSPKGEVA